MTEAEVRKPGKGRLPFLRKRYRLLAAGLFLWWVFALLSADIFPFDGYDPVCPIIVRVCLFAATVIVLAVFAKWRDALRPWVMRTAAIAAIVASFVLGTAQMAPIPPVLLYACALIAGACAACFFLGWGVLYAKYHLEKIVSVALLSVAIGAALLWLETLIPAGGFRGLLMILAPIVHLGMFYDIDFPALSADKMTETEPKFKSICLFTPPVHGLIYGILAGVGLFEYVQTFNPVPGAYAFGLALVFAGFAGVAAFVLHRLQFNIIHRPVIVLLIPLIMMVMFVLADDRWHPDFWILCALVLYLTFLWIATVDIADILNVDPIWFFGTRFAASFAALGIGFAAGYGIVAAFSPTSYVVLGVVIVMLAFQVVSSITTMEDQQALDATAETAVTAAETEISMGDMCASLGEKYALSAREVEVLELLAQGRDPSRIQEQLFLSYHTVRNHIKSIYRKLDVHSRQELIDVLEKEMDLLKQAQAAKPTKKKSSGNGRSKAAKAETTGK